MNALVMLFGALLCAAGVWVIAQPRSFTSFLTRLQVPGALWSIAALRIVMGVTFVLAAPPSRLPIFLEVLGWVAVVSGLITPFFGGERFGRLLAWWTARPIGFIRAWGAVALVIGGAVVFAGT